MRFLHEGWKFRQVGEESWCAATVPGCVHTDLLDNGLIDDPFYRDNEQKLQWIEEKDWEYQTTFTVDRETMQHQHIELVFEGLDTYAAVFLNNSQILDANNMFRGWRVECKDKLKEGENVLRVVFRSATKEVLPRLEGKNYKLPAAHDHLGTSPYTRKAPYHYGWDWGPRFVTCGVWRPVFLDSWSEVRIVDLHFSTEELTDQRAVLVAHLEAMATHGGPFAIEIEELVEGESHLKKKILLVEGLSHSPIRIQLDNSKRWWPNGMGEQFQYRFRATLSSVQGDMTYDQLQRNVGLRTLELRREPDQWGKSFEFVINGVPVFAKGGNWIPADNFVNRVTRKRYYHLLKSCKDANMNMLRVWGGGIYESEDFYDLCDEMGIMVWQDFIFACGLYPGDEDFLRNVEEEAVYQVKRLRNHPSIVLWCGNNEIETAWFDWGWMRQFPAQVWEDYEKVFHELLPRVCRQHDPSRPYWPSSPSSNSEAEANSQGFGDVHYWGVWHGTEPFESYEKQYPRFMSEYGFQSFPELKTVNYYTLPEDHDIESAVMVVHQKNRRGNQLIREYMLRHFPEPKDFSSFLYISQILQAEGIKNGAEHLRRIMPRCMGSLYWQINDCWPVASWASIDYFGRWKALHYYARRFYNDVSVSPNEEDGAIKVYIVCDRQNPTSATLAVSLLTFDGDTLRHQKIDVTVEPLSSRAYMSLSKGELLHGVDKNGVFLYCELQEGGNPITRNTYFFEPTKELLLPRPRIDVNVSPNERGVHLTVNSDKFARDVYLSTPALNGFFTDNYFDLVPGRSLAIEFISDEAITADEFRENLEIISLVDAF